MKNWHKKYIKTSCLNKIYIDLEKAKYYFAEITDLCRGVAWHQLPIRWCLASSSI